MGTLQTVICQHIGQPRRNEYISRICNLLGLSQLEIDNLHSLNTSSEIEFVIKKKKKKKPQQTNVQEQIASQGNSTKHVKNSYLSFSSAVQVTQSYLTLCNPMDYTVHGILQARILEWVAFPFSRGSSQPRDRTQVSHIAGDSYQLSHKGSPSFSSYPPPPKKKIEEKGTLPDSFYEASYPDTNARQRYYK